MLATMHGKERVIAPLLADGMGLHVVPAPGLDTDRFGTFSREIARTGSQLDAARAKIAAGFDRVPSARVGIASEGSFGPHPLLPFLPLGREVVMLIDRESGLELIGQDASLGTNYGHAIVTDVASAIAFAERVRFPEHGVIVMGCVNKQPAPDHALMKDSVDRNRVEAAVRGAIAACGAGFIEADMRAHRNPTRMRAIERATADLVRLFHSRCPACAQPGYDATERVPGLPCGWCGEPTRMIELEVLSCRSCGHRDERRIAENATADPGTCAQCNP